MTNPDCAVMPRNIRFEPAFRRGVPALQL